MIEKSKFFAKVCSVFEKNGLEQYISDEILDKFYNLTEIMLETNEKMNITAITDIDAVIERHYADSLLMLSAGIDEGAKILDVGCGGGFPSFPIAIARPDVTVTGLDSTAKKIAYVNETAKKLELSNLTAISARAEELAFESEMREKLDVVTARAVASLPILSELCLPFVKVGGKFVALKSKTAEEELQSARRGIEKLGGRIEKVEKTALRSLIEGEEDAERTIISVKKVAHTEGKYPRAYAQIKKKPL